MKSDEANITFGIMPAMRVIGKSMRTMGTYISPADDPLPGFWEQCEKNGTMDTLHSLDRYTLPGYEGSVVLFMTDFNPITGFVGMFAKLCCADTPVPIGFEHIDQPWRPIAKGIFYGSQTEGAHDKLAAGLGAYGYYFMPHYWFTRHKQSKLEYFMTVEKHQFDTMVDPQNTIDQMKPSPADVELLVLPKVKIIGRRRDIYPDTLENQDRDEQMCQFWQDFHDNILPQIEQLPRIVKNAYFGFAHNRYQGAHWSYIQGVICAADALVPEGLDFITIEASTVCLGGFGRRIEPTILAARRLGFDMDFSDNSWSAEVYFYEEVDNPPLKAATDSFRWLLPCIKPTEDKQFNWLDNLNDAVQYIEDNLQSAIDYKEISRILLCPIQVFQRFFALTAGYSLSEYIRRRRLSTAAGILQNTNKRIIDIAQCCGYESADAFTVAFKRLYGISPSAVREERPILQKYGRIVFSLSVTYQDEEDDIKDIREIRANVPRFELAHLPEAIIAGRAWHITPEDCIQRSDLWEEVMNSDLLDPLIEMGRLLDNAIIGWGGEHQADGSYTYLVGVLLPADITLPEGIDSRLIPEGILAKGVFNTGFEVYREAAKRGWKSDLSWNAEVHFWEDPVPYFSTTMIPVYLEQGDFTHQNEDVLLPKSPDDNECTLSRR